MLNRDDEMTHIDLKKLEKKAFTSYHEDGIVDIFAGAWILFFGIFSMCTDRPWFAGMFPVYGLPFFALAKKKITVPRIGYVKFSQQRTSLMFIVFLWITAIFTVFGIMLYTDNSPSWVYALLHDYPKLLFGIIVGLLFFVCAWVTRILRFYAYTALILAASVIGHVFGPNIQYEYFPLVLGVLILSVGVLVLIQFIQTYPVEMEEIRR
ncbi:MAG: hypothetical protein HXS48_20135 [Theionarchaea archaeon]|nr:MAG: hypothetical protein AYK19_00480 [Theionarchaea archaeon DG-70-1]MBU7029257.1 hypothetical protein [Theionarchaea archaeon]